METEEETVGGGGGHARRRQTVVEAVGGRWQPPQRKGKQTEADRFGLRSGLLIYILIMIFVSCTFPLLEIKMKQVRVFLPPQQE